MLGVGEHSIVYRGNYDGKPVAVKKLDCTIPVEEFKIILAEVKAMAHVGDHANIIKFLGADVSRIKNRKQYTLETALNLDNICLVSHEHNFLLKFF